MASDERDSAEALHSTPSVGGEKIRYIYKIMEKISGSSDIDVVGRDIVDIMADALGCIGGALFIVDEEQGVLRPFTYSRVSAFVDRVIPRLAKPFQDHLFDLAGDNLTVRTVRDKKVLIGDRYEEFMMPALSRTLSRAIQRAVGMRSIVSAPTIAMGKVVGVFQIAFREERIADRQLSMVKLFADQCAVAIGNAQRFEKLRSQRGELEGMLAQQSDFMVASTHELRTPLAAASFQIQALAESLEKHGLAELQEEAADASRSLDRLRSITDKILAVQAYDAKKVRPYIVPVNLDDFCASVLYKHRSAMESRGLDWKAQKDLPPRFVFPFDPDQIGRMLDELVGNAMSFTPAQGTVTFRVCHEGDELLLSVIDTGEGVPDTAKESIFRRFRSNHAMRAKGIGLGLCLAQKILELHEGSIRAEDTPGGGATFVARLPRRPATAAASLGT